MAICGVICEYNPFHLGHEKQLRLVRGQLGGDAVVVALMSETMSSAENPRFLIR